MDKMQDIMAIIPHRPPFLWVDKIIESTATSIVTEKKVAEDLDVFTGHYPLHPILPGVLLCEGLFQSGAILVALLTQKEKTSPAGVPVVTRIENAKFKRPVGPGNTLTMQVILQETLSNVWFLKGISRVKGKVAAKVNFCCTLAQLP